jgi:hypothetical protein
VGTSWTLPTWYVGCLYVETIFWSWDLEVSFAGADGNADSGCLKVMKT